MHMELALYRDRTTEFTHAHTVDLRIKLHTAENITVVVIYELRVGSDIKGAIRTHTTHSSHSPGLTYTVYGA